MAKRRKQEKLNQQKNSDEQEQASLSINTEIGEMSSNIPSRSVITEKHVMKTDQHSSWYSGEKLKSLLDHYVGSEHINITEALSTVDQLSNHLQLLIRQQKQHIIPLNVSALTGELGTDTNHWIGLHIFINRSNNSVTVKYIDPMGHAINSKVQAIIEQGFSVVQIEQPLLNNGIQYVQQKSVIELFGNINDCGPMLVYIMTCLTRVVDPIKISSHAESVSLGNFLRSSFEKKTNFNEIYATFKKNTNNTSESIKNVVNDNDKDSVTSKEHLKNSKIEQNNFDEEVNNKENTSEITSIQQTDKAILTSGDKQSSYNLKNKFITKTDYDSIRKKIEMIGNKIDRIIESDKVDVELKNIIEKDKHDKEVCFSTFDLFKKYWYDNDEIEQLLTFYVKSNICETRAVIASFDMLEDAIKSIDFSEFKEFILPLHVNVNTRSFATQDSAANHWTTIRVHKNNQEEIALDYVDPTGNKINCEVKNLIERLLPDCKVKEIFDKNNRIQYFEKGNDYDCGPMVIYATQALCNNKKIIDIKNYYDSITLGKVLRDNYLKETEIDLDTPQLGKEIEKFGKILLLQYTDKKDYGTILLKLAYDKSPEGMNTLSYLLSEIGKLNIAIGEISGDLKFYTDSAVCYQYVISILTKDKPEDKKKIIKETLDKLGIEPYEKLSDIKKQIVNIVTKDDIERQLPKEELENISIDNIDRFANKKTLDKLRQDTKETIKKIDNCRLNKQDKEYVNQSKKLFADITDTMSDYLAKLFAEAEQILGDPPCKYTIAGLGSMALMRITPYSDLEFIILTANDTYRKSKDKKISEYFKNLSHYVNFKMICLGETIIPTSKYDIDMSKFVSQAVNFDLGGKTSLGRMDKKKPYDLIQTVDKMLWYVKNEELKAEHIDKNLPYILEKVRFVYGERQIIEEYQGKVKDFLSAPVQNGDGQLNCEARSIKILTEGTTEIDYTQKTTELKTTQIIGDLYKGYFDPYGSHGKLFEVKKEIYRMPDRLIYSLALFYNIQGNSIWDAVDQLQQKAIITGDAADNLKKAATFAVSLRLKTYDYYGCQKEKMSIYASEEIQNESQITKSFRLNAKDLSEEGALFEFYYTMLELRSKLVDFCKEQDSLQRDEKQEFFKETAFYQDNVNNKAKICTRLLQYEKALEYEKKNLEELQQKYKHTPNHPDVAASLHNLGNTCGALGDHKQALEYQKQALIMRQEIFSDKHPDVAASLNNVGSTYGALGDHKQALEYQKQALAMMKDILGDKHPDVAAILHNIGSTYGKLGNHKTALEYQKQAFIMRQEIFGDKHPDVATSLNNVGSTYGKLGNHKTALEYQKQALNMLKEIFGDKHPDVATSLHNIGSTYGALGDHKTALEYQKQALNMSKEIFGDKHPHVAASLNNVGSTYRALGNHKTALEYQKQALNMNTDIFGNKHPDVAASLHNVGSTYGALGDHKTALEYQKQALNMSKEIFGDKHPHVAASLNNVGSTYRALGDHQQALEYQNQALNMSKEIFGDKHPHVATSLGNIGSTYSDLGDHQQALEYQKQALNMSKEIFGDKHPSVAASLNNVGSTYGALGDHQQALEYQKQALAMNKEILGDKHPSVAASLNNVGYTYGDLGDHQQALDYQKLALNMRKEIFGDKHPHVANSLNNVGYTYGKLGNHKTALEYLEPALIMRKEIFGDKHPSVAASLNNVGSTYGALGDHQQALEYQKQALAMNKEIFSDKHPDVAAILHNIGSTYGDLGDHQQALEYLEQALIMRQEIFSDKHPSVAASLNNVGYTYGDLGDHQQALEYQKQALAMNKEILGDKHPSVANSLGNIGYTYGQLGDHNKALEYQNQALAMNKEILGDKHPSVAASLNNVGSTYGALGDHQQALEYQKLALNMRKEIFGDKHPDVANSLGNIGSTYGALGDHKTALEYQKQALNMRKEIFGDKHPHVATSLGNIGSTYGALGDHQQALEYQKQALAMNKEIFGDKHPHVAAILHNIGYTYGALGDHQQALEYQKQALNMSKEIFGDKHPSVAASLNNVGSTTALLEITKQH